MEERPRLARKRKVGTVVPPVLQNGGLTRKTPRTTCNGDAGTPGLPVKRGESDHAQWSVEQVMAYLSSRGFDKTVCAAFEAHQIEGSHLASLTEETFNKMNIKAIGVQKKLLLALKSLQQRADGKVFNDPIHGHYELHPLLIKVIDTPQFQRLRSIKQLGGGYFVFPGASHNRFEHSLGVSYIAGEFVESLQRRQPELGITNVDVLCVKMAGLCHDLGHGPFSHMFDSLFIPKACPNRTKKWRHEDGSIVMLDYLLEENGLRPEFRRYGLNERDIVFIKEMIAGPLQEHRDEEEKGLDIGFIKEIIAGPLEEQGLGKELDEEVDVELCESPLGYSASPSKGEVWPYTGRTVEKSFLYEIVANKRNGVDVDKWDYFARDCHCLGIPNNFDMLRYMKFTRVISVNGKKQICARDKEVNNLYEMFHTRDGLHRRAYQHKTSNIVEYMITEALLKADNHFFLPGKDGPVKMSEAINDMTAYTQLTDAVTQQIKMSCDPALEDSKRLLLQIDRRQLYKCIGQTQPSRDMTLSEEEIRYQLVDSFSPGHSELPQLTPEDFVVQVVKFDYGMKEKNPIDMMRFYVKGQPETAVKVRKDQVSQMLPHTFQEKSVRVYCKRLDKPSIKAAWKHFICWCNKQQQFITPKGYISSSQDGRYDVLEDDDDCDDEEMGVVTPYGTPYGTPVKNADEEQMSNGFHVDETQPIEHDVKKKLFGP